MVLHLRYPNAHTHWFSSAMLYLFHEIQVAPQSVRVGRFIKVLGTESRLSNLGRDDYLGTEGQTK